jgi:type III pantothenate kinase
MLAGSCERGDVVSGPIVVDVGNTRVKWGRCEGGRVAEVVALPLESVEAWQQQLERWPDALRGRWVVSGVRPDRRDVLLAWLRGAAAEVLVLDSYRQLPLLVRVDEPEKVGIDRLLNAVAANTRRPQGGAVVIVDAGSAVTVDLVDPTGVFRGGAIFPGMRLMARALHEHTALLPMVDVDGANPPPGTTTAEAIRVGIFYAVLGGITELQARYWEQYGCFQQTVYVTGGDGPMLCTAQAIGELWPEMTLEGTLHSLAKTAIHG